ncbi:hypothetical protein Tco_0981812 [Tanacetum coccineum]
MTHQWAWVALGPERQPNVAAGTPGATKDAPAADEGAHADPAPELRRSIVRLRGDVAKIITYQSRFVAWMDAIRRPCCKEIDDIVYSDKDVC